MAPAPGTTTGQPVTVGAGGAPAPSLAVAPPAATDAGAVKQAPFVPRDPPEAWASWPMPNAQLPGLVNPQKYDTSDRNGVVDQVTGLMWQGDVGNTFMTFDDAQRACGALQLAGHDDWRLPSRIELISLLDMARTQPSINTIAFPTAPSEWFWTSTTSAGHPEAAWYVYFYAGYPKTDDKGNRFSVRCVRTAVPRQRPATHYQVLTGAVQDLATGLIWQRKAPDKKLTLDAARSYCKQLTLDGKRWRLPTEGELFTLVDESRAEPPMIDPAAFPGTPGEPFWSSSFFANGPAMAWYTAFDHGDGRYGFPSEKYRVRCVK